MQTRSSPVQAGPSEPRTGHPASQTEPAESVATATAVTRTSPGHRHHHSRRHHIPRAVSSNEASNLEGERSHQSAPSPPTRKRRRVQEPPTDPSSTSGIPVAKRQNTAHTNASTNSETVTAGPPPSALDQLELDLIEYPAGVRTWQNLSSGNLTMNVTLCEAFTDPDNIIKAISLLSQISSGNAAATTIDTTTIPGPSALGVRSVNVYSNLLEASHQAATHLSRVDGAIAATRIKTIMSYLVIFFTVEFAFVEEMKRKNPNEPDKSVNGRKYREFAERLNEVSTQAGGGFGSITNPTTVRSHSKYGRTFWEYGQKLGIASLLVFAVMDKSLTRIGEAGVTGIPALAAALTTSGTWWAFAHVVGPGVFRTLFGARDIEYSIPQLLTSLRSEPVTLGTISALNKVYRVQPQPSPSRISSQPSPLSELPESEWKIMIGGHEFKAKRHPAGTLEIDQVRKRNIGTWLQSTPGDDIVQDPDGNTIPFDAFKTLLPLNNISNDLVNFFTRVYNTRAIPGRLGLPYGGLTTTSGCFQEFLRSIHDTSNNAGSQLDMIVCPFDFEASTIGVVLFPKDSVLVTYDWTGEEGLAEGIVKVRNLLQDPSLMTLLVV